jgi:hypothetical protein
MAFMNTATSAPLDHADYIRLVAQTIVSAAALPVLGHEVSRVAGHRYAVLAIDGYGRGERAQLNLEWSDAYGWRINGEAAAPEGGLVEGLLVPEPLRVAAWVSALLLPDEPCALDSYLQEPGQDRSVTEQLAGYANSPLLPPAGEDLRPPLAEAMWDEAKTKFTPPLFA